MVALIQQVEQSLLVGNGSIDDGAISYYSPNNVSASNGSLTLTANNNSEGGRYYTGGLPIPTGNFIRPMATLNLA
jgi:hypothetical protein